jgi:hypothetical protein
MRLETRRALDWLVWRQRVRLGLIALGVAAVAVAYGYAYWPDPVVETRIVSGVVTGTAGATPKSKDHRTMMISVSLDDGRDIVIVQPPPPVLLHGPAEIEERRHRSGRVSFLWVKPRLDQAK